MRIAVYVRVSTPLQVKLQTIDQQLEIVSQYIKQKGWKLPAENIFRDDGYSGATLKRPALDALRDKVRLRELEVVVTLSPDRLARNYVHQMVLIEELEKHGCRVEFVERPMSTDPNDQLLLQIRGAVAEYERTLLTERMRRGRLTKLKRLV
jgi:site-specific DNA recombinase